MQTSLGDTTVPDPEEFDDTFFDPMALKKIIDAFGITGGSESLPQTTETPTGTMHTLGSHRAYTTSSTHSICRIGVCTPCFLTLTPFFLLHIPCLIILGSR